jgi:hypothetical protein
MEAFPVPFTQNPNVVLPPAGIVALYDSGVNRAPLRRALQ